MKQKIKIDSIIQFLVIAVSFLTFNLKYTLYWSFAFLFFIIVSLYIIKLEFKLKIFKYFILLFSFYLFFLLLGIGNPAFLQDLRLNTVFFVLLIVFYNFFLTENFIPKKFIKYLFYINILIFIFYLSFKLGILSNFYETEKLAGYQNYRTIGPLLFSTYMLPFLYLLYNLKKDKIFYVNFLLSGISILINGSLQNLTIFFIIYSFAIFRGIKFNDFKAKWLLLFLTIPFVMVIISKNIDDRYIEKLKQIKNPLESGTVQTRINDLSYMLPRTTSTFKEIIIGSGVGINSVVFRENKKYPVLTRYRTFLEVDNGFFYIFHRYGILGLIIIIFIHIQLFFYLPNRGSKISFIVYFIISNLLSYHYWVYAGTPFMLSAILAYRKNLKEK